MTLSTRKSRTYFRAIPLGQVTGQLPGVSVPMKISTDANRFMQSKVISRSLSMTVMWHPKYQDADRFRNDNTHPFNQHFAETFHLLSLLPTRSSLTLVSMSGSLSHFLRSITVAKACSSWCWRFVSCRVRTVGQPFMCSRDSITSISSVNGAVGHFQVERTSRLFSIFHHTRRQMPRCTNTRLVCTCCSVSLS